MRFRLVLLVTACLMVACDDENETERVLIEIKLDPSYLMNTITWAFASTPSGELLTSAELTKASSVVLKTTSDVGSVNLSIFMYEPKVSRTEEFFSVITYTDVPVNSTINFSSGKNPSWTTLPNLGVANIDVIGPNVPSYEFQLSSKKLLYSVMPVAIAGGLRYACTVRANPEDVLISGYRNDGMPVYKWVNGVVPNQTSTINLNEFVPFTKTIDFLLPDQAGLRLIAVQDQNSPPITLSNAFRFTPGILKVGILDGFESYGFLMYKSYPNGSFEHHKFSSSATFSPKPPPDLSFSISNPSIDNFQFSISETPSYCRHSWLFSDFGKKLIGWTVVAPGQSFPNLSQTALAIQGKYPDFDFVSLTHKNTVATFRQDDFTYSDFVKESTESAYKPIYEYTLRMFRSH